MTRTIMHCYDSLMTTIQVNESFHVIFSRRGLSVYVKIGSMWVLVFSLMTGGLGFFLEPKGLPAVFFSSKKHVVILSLGYGEINIPTRG